MSEETIKAAVEESLSPAKFNFVDAILDRDYPEIPVPVYFNERKVREMLSLEKERKKLEHRLASGAAGVEVAEKFEAIDKKYQKLVDELRDSRWTVTIKGVSPEELVKLSEKVYEEFPQEYTESTHPLSGATIKTEVESAERDEKYGLLLRAAHIHSVTNPKGEVDDEWNDVEKVRVLWSKLPFMARKKINEAIEEATVAVDFYRELADEVF